MGDLGLITILIALALAAYSVVASVLGQVRNIPSLVESGRYAAYLVMLALVVSTFSLVSAFLSNDFELEYVFAHSNLAIQPRCQIGRHHAIELHVDRLRLVAASELQDRFSARFAATDQQQ